MSQDLERWMKRFQPPRPPAGLRRRIFGEATETSETGATQTVLVDDRRDAETVDRPAVVPSFRPPSRTTTTRSSFWRLAAASTVATAAVLLVLAVLATAPRIAGLADRSLAETPPDQQTPPVPTDTRLPSEAPAPRPSKVAETPTSDDQNELVACVIGFESVTWKDEAQSYVMHQRLSPGDCINIESGRLKLVFDCGVQMVLEGPAELEVLGKKQVRMSTGIITARAWDGGQGFTIDTPQADIVDLSTEFGVRVDEEGRTDVAVFEGAIDVFQQDPESPADTMNAPPKRLSSGDVIRYGGEEDIPPEPPTDGAEIRAGQDLFNIIEWHDRVTSWNQSGVNIMNLDGIVVDAGRDDCTGDWICSQVSGKWVGDWYYHDMKADQGAKSIRFAVRLPKPGRYEVRMAYSSFLVNDLYRRASNVPVDIQHAMGTKRIRIDQRGKPPIDELFVSLGVYPFDSDQPAVVTVSNEGADGFVTADAIQFLPVE